MSARNGVIKAGDLAIEFGDEKRVGLDVSR